MELRIKSTDLNMIDSELKIGGYVNVTERESEILYCKKSRIWFIEVMKLGVFKNAIDCSSNIPLLLEHDWSKQLASTLEGSLSLTEDNIGLKFEATIKDKETYEKIKSKKINSCSFGFRIVNQDIVPINNHLEKHVVNQIELLEVSVVENPAYVGSLAETRAYEQAIANEENPKKKDNPNVKTEDGPNVKTKEKTPDLKDKEKEDSKEKTPDLKDGKSLEPEKNIKKDVSEKNKDKEDAKRNVPDTSLKTISLDEVELKAIVDELISQKLADIQKAEKEEVIAQQTLQEVVEVNETFEKDAQALCNQKNCEVIKMRLDLLKLKNLKDGI